ncbi:hypothetical protein N9A94_09230 [Akkermansiaceae bacterium]|nr:hypothetical protein [Akkermansiaceae bacterium]
MTHNVGDVSSLTVDEEWKFHLVDPVCRDDRFMYSATFFDTESKIKGESLSVVVYTVLDPPRDVLLTIKPEEIAKANAKPMISIALKADEGARAGDLMIFHRKGDDENRWHYKQVLSHPKKAGVFTVFGMIWKTDHRCHGLQSFSTGLVDQYGFWDGFLKKWKKLDWLNEVHANSYRARGKFLTEEQRKKLKDVTKSEWASDLELRGMAEALAKKEDPVKRRDYEKLRLHAAARKMRLIYHQLLTEKQKKDFDKSVRTRLEEIRK